MLELQGFVSWLKAKHSDSTEIIETALLEHFPDTLDGTETLRVDYARIQSALNPVHRETLQDLYDEYSREYPYILTR